MLLLGPPGCGKTLGIHAEAQRCGVGVNEVFGADLRGSADLFRDLRMACTRAHVQEAQRPLAVLDNVDALPPENAKGLFDFLQTRGAECGPLVIAGTQPLPYHMRALYTHDEVFGDGAPAWPSSDRVREWLAKKYISLV